MYDEQLYSYDRNSERHAAALRSGAYLYRLTSLQHNGVEQVLDGGGTLNNPSPGRYNSPQQRTSYCSNNILVNIAEVLFHMYRRTLQRIENKDPSDAIRASLQEERSLVVVRVDEIEDLIYVDAEDVRTDFDPRVCGTSVVFPDAHYKFLWDFNNVIRQSRKKGVFYPSARHSVGLAIALFYDESVRIQRGSYDVLNIRLQLVPETQDFTMPPTACRPFDDKLHSTMGYYAFRDASELDRLRKAGALNPMDIPDKGMIDFVRRRYRVYPDGAVCG